MLVYKSSFTMILFILDFIGGVFLVLYASLFFVHFSSHVKRSHYYYMAFTKALLGHSNSFEVGMLGVTAMVAVNTVSSCYSLLPLALTC